MYPAGTATATAAASGGTNRRGPDGRAAAVGAGAAFTPMIVPLPAARREKRNGGPAARRSREEVRPGQAALPASAACSSGV
nr:hypothetical protein KPHV_25300 [Kitasatospora purpeofusca]